MTDVDMSSSLTTSSPAHAVSAVVLDYSNVLYTWEPMAAVAGYVSADDWGEFIVDGGLLTWSERLDQGESFGQVLADYTRAHPGRPDWTEIPSLHRQRFVDSLTGPVPGMVTLLNDLLGRGMALYGLTNFDVMSLEWARLPVPQLEHFMGIVVSGRGHLAKPSAAVFDLLLSHYRLQAPSILFIDDSTVNIEAVGRLRTRTHHFIGVGQLRSELIVLGLLPTPDRH